MRADHFAAATALATKPNRKLKKPDHLMGAGHYRLNLIQVNAEI
jgi:hypothetical protein